MSPSRMVPWGAVWSRVPSLVREMGDLLLPGRCLGCDELLPLGRADDLVCTGCRMRLREPPWPRCPRCHFPVGTGREPESTCLACGEWPAVLRRARWCVLLRPPADALVHGLKYRGWRELAPVLAARMARVTLPERSDLSCVVPVPTTRRRERERGYNQARLLAVDLAATLDLPLHDLLVRREGGRTQVSLKPSERRANVSGAFGLRGELPRGLDGSRALLVDDVLTTGATASAAAVTLERGGASGVTLIAFARSVPGWADSTSSGPGPEREPRSAAGGPGLSRILDDP